MTNQPDPPAKPVKNSSTEPRITNINTEGAPVYQGKINLGPHALFVGRDYIQNNQTNIYNLIPSPLDKWLVSAILNYGGFFLLAFIFWLVWRLIYRQIEPLTRYLLPDTFWFVWLVLGWVVIWFAQTWAGRRAQRGWINRDLLLLGVSVAVLGGSLAWPQLNPLVIPTEPFVIAVADLGESAGLANIRPTREGAIISRRIFEELCLLRGQNDDLGSSHCPPDRLGTIVIQQVGFASDQESALQLGERVSADIVLWGSYERSNNQNLVKLYYTITQALDPIYDNDRPTIVPVRYNEVCVRTPADRDQVVTASSHLIRFIWPVTLGLDSYQDRNFSLAKSQLKIALTNLDEAGPQLTDCGVEGSDGIDENQTLLNFFLGRSLQWTQEFEEAEQALLAATDEPAAWISLGINDQLLQKPLDSSTEKFNTAAEMLLAIQDNPTQPKINRVAGAYGLARVYFLQGDVDQAALSYADALTLSNSGSRPEPFFPGLISLGQLIIDQDNLSTEMVQACQSARVPFDTPVLCAQGLFENALSVAEDAHINPGWVYRNLGRTAEKAGDPAAAEAYYWQAVESNPWEIFLYETYAGFLLNRCRELANDCRLDETFLKLNRLEDLANNLTPTLDIPDQRPKKEAIVAYLNQVSAEFLE